MEEEAAYVRWHFLPNTEYSVQGVRIIDVGCKVFLFTFCWQMAPCTKRVALLGIQGGIRVSAATHRENEGNKQSSSPQICP